MIAALRGWEKALKTKFVSPSCAPWKSPIIPNCSTQIYNTVIQIAGHTLHVNRKSLWITRLPKSIKLHKLPLPTFALGAILLPQAIISERNLGSEDKIFKQVVEAEN